MPVDTSWLRNKFRATIAVEQVAGGFDAYWFKRMSRDWITALLISAAFTVVWLCVRIALWYFSG